MVRIGKGSQQRCVWPVHLSGWQQLGWQLVGHSEPQAEPNRTTRSAAASEPWDLPEAAELTPAPPTTAETSDD
jgi:hypothetical protein